VVVLNLPYTYPTYEVNGVMVAGWDAPSTESFTYPQDLKAEILDLLPDYGSTLDLSLWNYFPTDSEDEFDSFIGKLVRSFEQSATLASHFMRKQPWDVFMVHFQQTDWIQHKLWGYIERACQESKNKDSRLEKVRRCYGSFDEHLGHVFRHAGSFNPLLVVLSDHGFGANRGSICPNYLLRELGYYKLKTESGGSLKGTLKHSRFKTVRNLYRTVATAKNTASGRQAMGKYKSWADMTNATVPNQKTNVDWSRTKAAFVGGSETAFIFINTKDRGPNGCVEPGTEYEDLVTHILREFGKMSGLNGEKLFQRVARGTDVYPSSGRGVLLPDIVLMPIEGYVVGSGTAEAFLPSNGEQGDHRRAGILLMQGAALVQKPDTKFHPTLVDIAPTILHASGVPVPSDMDGRVLEDLFRIHRPVLLGDLDTSRLLDAQDYSGTETDLVEQRLRGLGYVE
jgi:predicted AlkP superfamily phosphohydrolase/phosphomutase